MTASLALGSPWPQVGRDCQPVCLFSSVAPAALGFSTKVLNATSVQASWELPPQLGPIQGFKLFHRKLPAAHFEGLLLLASSVRSFLYTDLGEDLNLLVTLKARPSQCDLAPGTELPGP